MPTTHRSQIARLHAQAEFHIIQAQRCRDAIALLEDLNPPTQGGSTWRRKPPSWWRKPAPKAAPTKTVTAATPKKKTVKAAATKTRAISPVKKPRVRTRTPKAVGIRPMDLVEQVFETTGAPLRLDDLVEKTRALGLDFGHKPPKQVLGIVVRGMVARHVLQETPEGYQRVPPPAGDVPPADVVSSF